MWDLETNTLLKTFAFDETLHDATVTNIQFSPNAGFLVAGGGVFRNYSTKIYKIPTLVSIHTYKYGATDGIDITNDSSLIAIGYGTKLIILTAHWLPSEVSISQENIEQELYPNPTTEEVNINIPPSNKSGSGAMSVKVYDVLGIEHPVSFADTPLSEGNLRLDVSSLPSGVYFVRVGGQVLKFVKL